MRYSYDLKGILSLEDQKAIKDSIETIENVGSCSVDSRSVIVRCDGLDQDLKSKLEEIIEKFAVIEKFTS